MASDKRWAEVPWLLVALRLGCAGAILADGVDGRYSRAFVPLVLVGFFSDVFDGIVARRVGCDDARLRMADSLVDIGFYGAIAATVAWVRPELVRAHGPGLAVFFAVYGLWWAVNLARFGRPSSYHTYLAKTWNVSLAATAIAVGLGGGDRMLPVAIALGVARNLEEIAMTMTLPRWTHDVPSLVHALRLCASARAGGSGSVLCGRRRRCRPDRHDDAHDSVHPHR